MEGQRVHTQVRKSLERLEKTHPLSLIVSLLLVAGAAFFLYLMASLLALEGELTFDIDGRLVLGMVVLFIPAYFVSGFKQDFELERRKQVLQALLVSVISIALFLTSQYISWRPTLSSTSDSVNIAVKIFSLILISHAVLSFGVMLQLAYLASRYARCLSDPILSLLTFSNPFEKLKLIMVRRILIFIQIAWAFILIMAATLLS